MSLHIGLDIGGTKFLVAAANAKRKILRRIKKASPLDLNQGLNLLKEMITEASAGEKIAGIGAAIGGPLNWRTGVVSPLHQPEWRKIPLKTIMETSFKCPFHVDVDTNVAALGEYHAYAKPPRSLLYITISTGIGGGLVIEGRIYRGMKETHPEIGHQSINFRCSHSDKVICECGAPDCLEALVSGNGIRRIYGRSPERLDAYQWDEVAYNLGQGLRNLAAIYLPDVIILGGGLSIGGGEKLLSKARAVMQKHLKIVPIPEIHLSRLGYDTALIGAVYIAIHGIE